LVVPERRLVERTFTSTSPPDRVWAHLSDVSAWPSWAHHIRKVTLDPPGELTPTTRGKLVIKPALPTTFRMTALDAPRSWSWRGTFLGTALDYDHVVEPHDGGTRITFTIDGSGATAGVVGPAFAAFYGRLLDRAIKNLIVELDGLG
jgi:hypothetical protein